ncbi:MAG: hypothetical protein OXT65_01315 [Alphaproteobacteria bacterium]|nr:hypothetical protein [Alphaproteobacteria bacterium]
MAFLDPTSGKETVMMEFNHAAGNPTAQDVVKKFALKEADLQETVLPLERAPDKTTYIAFVEHKAAERVEKSGHPDFIQNWSNPKMEPFKP